MILGGIGMALTMSPMTSVAMASVPVDKAGVGSGVLNSFRQVGGSLGIAADGRDPRVVPQRAPGARSSRSSSSSTGSTRRCS